VLIGDILERRTTMPPSLILPNKGLIPDLRADTVVEVAGLVADGELGGRRVGELPAPVRGLVAREQEVQSLAVDAAIQGSRELALQALLLDPIVHSARAAEAFLDEALTRHRPQLPRFWA